MFPSLTAAVFPVLSFWIYYLLTKAHAWIADSGSVVPHSEGRSQMPSL